MKIEEVAAGVIEQLVELMEQYPNDKDLGAAVREELKEVAILKKEFDAHDEEIRRLTNGN